MFNKHGNSPKGLQHDFSRGLVLLGLLLLQL